MEYVVSFFVSAFVSWVLIPPLIRYAPQLGMLDAPGDRKVHSSVIPRCGGIAIAAGMIISAVLILPFDSLYYSVIIGGGTVVVFGIADDVLEINYKWKFLGQILAVSYIISQGVYIKVIPFMGMNDAPLMLSYILTVLFVVGSTNAVNLSDGLDGLAAGVMLLSLASIAIFSFFAGGMEVGVLAIGLIGSILSFLHFNTHPANIFMGDTGSQLIGFVAALLAIMLTQNVSHAYNPALPLLIMGLPILDTLSVMTQRIRVGRSPFSPDRRHLHHKLLDYGFGHEESVVVLYLLQAVFLASAFWLRHSADWEVVGFYLLVSALVLSAFYFAGKYHWQYYARSREAERQLIRLGKHSWFFTCCSKYIEYSIICYLLFLQGCLLLVSQPPWYLGFTFIMLALGAVKWTSQTLQLNLIRIGVYGSVLFIFYLSTSIPTVQQLIFTVADLFFFFLLMITSLAIMLSRQATFKLTTQDALVFLILLAAVFIIDAEFSVRTVLYLLCLGYALEYLFHKDSYHFRYLSFATIFSVLNFSVFFNLS